MKKFLLSCIMVLCCFVFFMGLTPSGVEAQTKFITIGTGGITGVYYPTGGAIAKIVNQKRAEYGIRCTVESTGGSVFNINAIMAGDLEFGIVQSDRQYQAVHGMAEWQDRGPQNNLRAVFSIHPEAITLVGADDAGINSIEDLKGKRVNIGNPGSGQRQNSIDALTAAGLDFEKDIKAESVVADEAPGLLQDGRIDAFFYTVGHPAGNIKEATAGKRKVRVCDVTGDWLEKLFEEKPYYAPAKIPAKFYPTALNTEDAQTFGVKATFVTSIEVPEEIVYAITKEVFENFEDFQKLHPAFEVLTKEGMLQGLSAELHPGAIKYYKEAGLIQ